MIHSRNLPFLTTLTIFVVAYLLCVLQYPSILSTRVIGNLLTDNAFLGIAAVGMTFVILSGGIDLSIGSVIAFTSVFVAVMVGTYNIHPLLAFAIVLAVSTLFGCLMGAMIRFLSIPPFVVTLAGMFLARGAAYLISTQSVPISHPFIDAIQGFYFRFPGGGRLTALAMLMLLVFAAGMLIASRTRFGANVYALGGNPQSAELMGVPIGATTIGIYALSGFLSGLAGIVYTLYTSSGYSLATVGVELDAIAAVVIGGTSLSGGRGTVLGTLIGALIISVLANGLRILSVAQEWQTVVTGCIIILAVYADILRRRAL